MLIIKELTVKNFMSVGNQVQAIKFANKNLVLVIGENMDRAATMLEREMAQERQQSSTH